MWSPSSSADESFGIATGEFTEAEKKYLLRKGLAWEDSKGDMFDVSTDVEDSNTSRVSDASSLNKSHDDSLLLFEENERLAWIQNASFTDVRGKNSAKPMGLIPKNFNSSDVSFSSTQTDFDEEEEDKENMGQDAALSFSNANNSPKSKANDSFQAVLTEKKIDFEEYARIVCQADQFRNEITKSICDPDELDEEGEKSVRDLDNEVDEESDSDCVMVACTQDVLDETASTDPDSEEARDVVPATQYATQGENSVIVEYEDDSMVIVPCTQYADAEDSMDLSVANISSVPCSQGSRGEGSSKEDLDDTITMMTKLLALADEQEAKERMEAESVLDDGENNVHVVEASVNEEEANCSKNADEAVASSSQEKPINADDALFKTPLKHTRVQLLKNRKMCTPSPPRSYVNQLLQRGAANKTAVIKGDPVKLATPSTPANKKPFISTSTPKRTPLTNITPVRKAPGLINGKTPVSAKIDTGMKRSPGFPPIGLSPVADYIHSKAAPSTFARVQGIPKQPPLISSASSKTSLPRPNNSFSRIPFRLSQAQGQPKTPQEQQKRHSVLKSDTYFDLKSTPPKIISNVKRFAAAEYKGPAKVKTTDGKVDSSPKKDFVAQRHTGIRDVSGNASFIQNATIQKRFIPIQSRLATPPSYCRK